MQSRIAHKTRFIFCALAIAVSVTPRVVAQGSLSAARQLYASAEYGDALTMLNALLAGNPPSEERQSIELYRTLCLVAVGNSAEANRAIEAMITRDPMYRPSTEEIPPRMRSAFSDARKKLLPSIIQQKYVVAKTAYDQKDLAAAAEGFKQVLAGLSDPDIAPAVEQAPLSDLKMLATGFQDLVTRAMAPPPQPVAAAPAAPPPAQVDAGPKIYTASDAGVVAPATIQQVLPPFQGKVIFAGAAFIEVLIDENGAVESAALSTPLHPQYDRAALNAAKTWQYRPATFEGVPVKFRKRVQISLVPNR